jgi:hypothetical protein
VLFALYPRNPRQVLLRVRAMHEVLKQKRRREAGVYPPIKNKVSA